MNKLQAMALFLLWGLVLVGLVTLALLISSCGPDNTDNNRSRDNSAPNTKVVQL